MPGARFIDETGKQYGDLIVLGPAGSRLVGTSKVWFWKCLCLRCGNHTEKPGKLLRRGTYSSCGCKRLSQFKLPKGKATLNFLIASAKRKAKERGYSWALTEIEFFSLIQKPCFYCGASPMLNKRYKQGKDEVLAHGVDRVNNRVGYKLSNCVSCCGICNKMKRLQSLDEFLNQIDAIFHTSAAKYLDAKSGNLND